MQQIYRRRFEIILRKLLKISLYKSLVLDECWNIVARGEITHDEQFLVLQQCLQTLHI